jgi:hypothetical protein
VYAALHADILALDGRCVVSAAAAGGSTAAFTAAAFFTLSVMAALVTFSVVMMITVRAGGDKFSAKIGLYCLVSVAFRACHDSDSGIGQRIQGASAQAAADQDFNGLVRKKPCQGTVADPVGSDDLTGDDPAVLHIIDLELLCSAEMLKNLTVFIGSCDSHVNKLPFLN